MQTYFQAKKEWKNSQIGKKWSEIRELRSVVTSSIEEKRKEGLLGSSLQAKVLIEANEDSYNVLQDINMRTLRRVPLLLGVQTDALGDLCSVIRRAVFLPEEILCRQGEVVTELFILESGVVSEIIYPDEDDDSEDDDFVPSLQEKRAAAAELADGPAFKRRSQGPPAAMPEPAPSVTSVGSSSRSRGWLSSPSKMFAVLVQCRRTRISVVVELEIRIGLVGVIAMELAPMVTLFRGIVAPVPSWSSTPPMRVSQSGIMLRARPRTGFLEESSTIGIPDTVTMARYSATTPDA